jgi:hypothetical protein
MPKCRTALTIVLTVLATSVVGAGTALAQVPAPDPAAPASGASTPAMQASSGHAGSPIWVFVLVAAVTMLVTVAITVTAMSRVRPLSERLT